MKKKIIIIFLIITAVVTGLFYLLLPVWAGIGNLDIYTGGVDVLRGSSVKNGQTGENVRVNDTIRTQDESRSGIILKDNTTIRFESGSEIKVGEIEYKDGKIRDAVFVLSLGQIWTSAKPVGPDGELRVETPTVVASVRGTEFQVIYMNGVSEVFVFEGSVAVALISNPSVSAELKAGEHVIIRDDHAEEDFKKGPSLFNVSGRDSWVIFNLGEIRQDAQPAITTFPSPLLEATIKPSPTQAPRIKTVPSVTTTPTPSLTSQGGYQIESTPIPEPKIISVVPSFVDKNSKSNSFFINGENLKNPVQVYLNNILIQAFLLDAQTIVAYVGENIQPGVYDVRVNVTGKTIVLTQALTVR